jgi:flagellar basal-body rod protein FlgB
MIGKLDEALRFHETALSLRAQRQQLLASNIANADTPNYKAKDIDFNSALKGALAKTATPVPGSGPSAATTAPLGLAAPSGMLGSSGLVRTSATHLPGSNASVTSSGAQVQFRTAAQGNVDGNTVDMDAERNQFVDNALRYEAGLTLVSGKIKTLLAAIQGQ